MKLVKSLLLTLAAAACIAAAPATDWARRVAAMPSGSFVVGNPAAVTQLVEYISYTCPHCAHFTTEASVPLRTSYLAAGKVNVEFRHAVRDRLDFAATLLARCGPPAGFLRRHEAILAAQADWMKKGATYDEANGDAVTKAGVAGGPKLLAHGSGLDALMLKQGLKPAQIAACLADARQQKLVGEMARAAWETDSIPGTPYFLINGSPQTGTGTWAALEPALRAAIPTTISSRRP